MSNPPKAKSPAKRKRRPTTARFFNNTLTWFVTGDNLDEQNPYDEYLDGHRRVRSAVLHGGLIASGLILSFVLLWLVA